MFNVLPDSSDKTDITNEIPGTKSAKFQESVIFFKN